MLRNIAIDVGHRSSAQDWYSRPTERDVKPENIAAVIVKLFNERQA